MDTLHGAHLHRFFNKVFRAAFSFYDLRHIRVVVEFEYFGADLLAGPAADAFIFIDIYFFAHLLFLPQGETNGKYGWSRYLVTL